MIWERRSGTGSRHRSQQRIKLWSTRIGGWGGLRPLLLGELRLSGGQGIQEGDGEPYEDGPYGLKREEVS